MTGRRRRRRAGGELWSAVDRRALAYVRLEGARSTDLSPHVAAIEELCASHGLELADIVVDVEGGAESTSPPPGLNWALERLAAGRAGALAVARAEHISGAFADAEHLAHWFRERRLKLVAADSAGGPAPGTAEAGAPGLPTRTRRRLRRVPGVGPGSWAGYVSARTDDGRLPNR